MDTANTMRAAKKTSPDCVNTTTATRRDTSPGRPMRAADSSCPSNSPAPTPAASGSTLRFRRRDEWSALSILTRWIVDTDRTREDYGLRLPGQEFAPAHGEAQRRNAWKRWHCLAGDAMAKPRGTDGSLLASSALDARRTGDRMLRIFHICRSGSRARLSAARSGATSSSSAARIAVDLAAGRAGLVCFLGVLFTYSSISGVGPGLRCWPSWPR